MNEKGKKVHCNNVLRCPHPGPGIQLLLPLKSDLLKTLKPQLIVCMLVL